MRTGLRVMGIDPGFASTGVAFVEEAKGHLRLLHGEVIRTAKDDPRAQSMKLRVSVDDGRRVGEIYSELVALIRMWSPSMLCLEAYVPAFGTRGNAGNAWKTAIITGVVHAIALQWQILCLSFLPMDLRREFKVPKGASKETVADAVGTRVDGLMECLTALPKGAREHVGDACGHAVLGLREARALRVSLGEHQWRR